MKNFLTYPHLLVALQFGLIGLMIGLSRGMLHSPVAIAVSLFGAAIGFWAIAYNQRGNFNIRPVLKEGCRLIMTGPYRLIRHPMYSSVITMMLGIVISTPTWPELAMLIMLIIVLYLKARREERLWCGHNPGYLSYKKRTKLFIPFLL